MAGYLSDEEVFGKTEYLSDDEVFGAKPMPYKNKAEALDDAVNLIQEGADRNDVFASFSEVATPDEILSYAEKRGAYTPDAVDPEVAKLARNYPAPKATGKVAASDYVPRADGLQRVEDVTRKIASGAVTGVKALTNLAGADNPVSGLLGDAQKSLQDGLSSEQKAADQIISGTLRDAEDKGAWEQIKAAGSAFMVDPLATSAEAIGTMVPTLAGGAMLSGVKGVQALGNVGSKFLGGAGGAASAQVAGSSLVGAGMGAGLVKEQIYEAVLNDSITQGATPEEAKLIAEKAQSYSESPFLIAGGAALGAAGGATGVESTVARMLTGKAVKELVETGVLKGTAKGVLKEAPLEGAQGGFEQLSGNIASQGAGNDVGTWRGVAGQAAFEAAAAGPMGGVAGGVEALSNKVTQREVERQKLEAMRNVAEEVPLVQADNILKTESADDAINQFVAATSEKKTSTEKAGDILRSAGIAVPDSAAMLADIAPTVEAQDVPAIVQAIDTGTDPLAQGTTNTAQGLAVDGQTVVAGQPEQAQSLTQAASAQLDIGNPITNPDMGGSVDQRLIPVSQRQQQSDPVVQVDQTTSQPAYEPASIAVMAAQISRREAPGTADPKIDTVAAQETYLQDLVRKDPAQATAVAQAFRSNPEQFSEAAGVTPDLVGRYASIIEKQVALTPMSQRSAKTVDQQIPVSQRARPLELTAGDPVVMQDENGQPLPGVSEYDTPMGRMAGPAPVQRTVRDLKQESAAVSGLAVATGTAGTELEPTLLPDVPDTGERGSVGGAIRAVAAISERVFGTPVSYVQSADSFYGVAHKGRVFINADQVLGGDGKNSVAALAIATIGHEAGHAGFEQGSVADRATNDKYLQAVAQYLKQDAVKARQTKYAPTEAKATSETMRDIDGAMWLDSKFWGRLYDVDNGSTFRKVAYKFMQGATKFITAAKGSRLDIDTLVTNVEAVREAAAQAWAAKATGAKAKSRTQLKAEIFSAPTYSPTGEQNEILGSSGVGSVPTDAGNNRPAPDRLGGGTPTYGQPREGAVSVVGRHYSKGQRTTLSGLFSGQGLKGAEQKRLEGASSQIRSRIYFYVDTGKGIRPESGVGGYAHEVRLNNIYDPATKLVPPQSSNNAFEEAVVAAGFDGYIDRNFTTTNGAVVLLGTKHGSVPVRYVQDASAAPSPVSKAPSTIKKGLLSKEANAVDVNNIPGAKLRMGNLEVPADQRDAANAEMRRIGSEVMFSRSNFEVAPDPNNEELSGKWNELPLDRKLTISRLVADSVVPRVLSVSGATGQISEQFGSYLADTNPSFALTLESGDVHEVSKQLGYVLSQDSMMNLSLEPFDGGEEVGAVFVVLGDKSFDEVRSIYDQIRAAVPEVGGQSYTDGTMTVLNYSDTPTSDLRQKIDAALGSEYATSTQKVYASFPQKEEYDYGTQGSDTGAGGGLEEVVRQGLDSLRGETSRIIEEELSYSRAEEDYPDGFFDEVNDEINEEAFSFDKPEVDSYEDVIAELNEQGYTFKKVEAPMQSFEAPTTPEFKKWFRQSKWSWPNGQPKIGFHGTAQDIHSFRAKQAGASFIAPDPDFSEEYAESSALWMKNNPEKWMEPAQYEDAKKAAAKVVMGMKEYSMSTRKSMRDDILNDNADGETLDILNAQVEKQLPSGPNIIPVWVSVQNPFDYETPSHINEVLDAVFADEGVVTVTPAQERPKDFTRDGLKSALRTGSWPVIESPEVQDAIKSLDFDGFFVSEYGRKNVAVYQSNQIKSVFNKGTYSLDDDRISFSRAESWAQNVLDGKNVDPGLMLMDSPPLPMQMFGLGRSNPVVVQQNLVRHMKNRDRSAMAPKMVAAAAVGLESPRAVIVSRVDGVNRYEAILDWKDSDDKPLLVSLRQDEVKMGGRAVRVADIRTMFTKDASLAYVLRHIKDGNNVWLAEKEVARVRDFTDEGLIPYGTNGAAPPRTSSVPDTPSSAPLVPKAKAKGVEVSQATSTNVYGPTALVKYKAGGNDWRLRKEYIRVTDDDIKRAGGVAFSRTDSTESTPDKRQSQIESENFKLWFGSSKVVDADGKPLVVYHGTAKDFSKFSLDAPRNMMAFRDAQGFYFTKYPDDASAYTEGDDGDPVDGSNVMPVYLQIKNPLIVASDDFDNHPAYISAARRKKLEADGYDGIIFADGVEYVVFRPEQVKSATGNNGQFSPTNPDIRYSRMSGTQGQNFTVAQERKRDHARRIWQDYFLPILRVQEAITGNGGLVSEVSDVYRAEERMYGRVEEALRDFREKEFEPLIQETKKAGLTPDELSLYAYAMHAPERNAQIAKINKRFPDDGSGMTDAEAAAILAQFQAEGKDAALSKLHTQLMAITNATRLEMLEQELITQDEYDTLQGMYENYVPLRGLDEDTTQPIKRGGGGFNIRGKETMRALGRRSRAGDILENIVNDYERAVSRGEQNLVAKTFLKLVQDNPDPGLWEIDAVRTKDAWDRQSGKVKSTTKIDTGPDTISVKLNGKEVFIKIHDEGVLRAMRKAFKMEVSGVERFLTTVFGGFNSMLRASLTQYNPVFGFVNWTRDFQMGAVGVLDELGAGAVAKFTKYQPSAMATANRFVQGKLGNSADDKLFQEFRAAGATTGGFYAKDAEQVRGEIRNLMLAMGAAPKKVFGPNGFSLEGLAENVKTGGGTKTGRVAMKSVQKIGSILEHFGLMTENATRFAAYKTAREMGKTPAQAASIAKNLTTNFNRKGEWGQAMNSAYLFFNAAVQGSHRTLKALKNRKIQGLMAGMVGVGAGLAAMAVAVGGDDEDDGQAYWDKIQSFEKERNFIIMLPPGYEMEGVEKVGSNGRYIKIPMPYGFSVFPALGYTLADVGRNAQDRTRGITVTKGAAQMLSAVMGSFNPFGGAFDVTSPSGVMMAAAPTMADVVIQQAMGRNSFDRPTAPFKGEFDTDPDSENVNPRQAGSVWHMIARGLNTATGGDEATPGAIDVAPGTIENAFKTVTGGTGTFLSDVFWNLPVKAMTPNAEITRRDLPLVRNFLGIVDGMNDSALLYERRRAILEARTVLKNYEDMGLEPKKMGSMDFALAYMAETSNFYSKAMSAIRKEEIMIALDEEMTKGDKALRLKELRKERDTLASEFNQAYMDVMRGERDGEFDVEK